MFQGSIHQRAQANRHIYGQYTEGIWGLEGIVEIQPRKSPLGASLGNCTKRNSQNEVSEVPQLGTDHRNRWFSESLKRLLRSGRILHRKQVATSVQALRADTAAVPMEEPSGDQCRRTFHLWRPRN